MAIYIVFKKVFDENQNHIDYEDSFCWYYGSSFNDQSSTNRPYMCAEPWATSFELTDTDILNKSKPHLVNNEWILEFDQTIADAYNAKVKLSQRDNLFKTMDREVYLQAYQTLKVPDAMSAFAWEATYPMMRDYPSQFSSIGLKVIMPTISYNEGDALDSNDKVSGYAIEAMDKLVDFAQWRVNRIKQWQDADAALVSGV